ncbi:AMT-type ammonium transporter [Chara braunii]|uniref:protein-serine/threonine phosphatase n=1 Tax=Chara braunii TaxID=69332 RepID=A0A388JQ00_CHABU|nr:AMT-type ammonium transporter [Chara braunii]|eukprot:GBG59851.1 AMT-type ammonium transporter [Chara braunii]
MADFANITSLVMQQAQNVTEMNEYLIASRTTGFHLWRLQNALFVFLMQVGFALLEAGNVRSKNTRNIMLKNVLDACLSAVAFWSVGWALAYGEGSAILGWRHPDDHAVAFFNARDPVGWFFSWTFAATSCTIVSGAVAERTQFNAYMVYSFVSSFIIYPVVVHMIWSTSGLLSVWNRSREDRILQTYGVLDNSGSLVVHVTGGLTSLIGAYLVGPRLGRFDLDGNPIPFRSHSMVFTAAGVLILWAGFYGFNAGSVLLSAGQSLKVWWNGIARVCVNTTLTAAFSAVSVYVLTSRHNVECPSDLFNSVIGGLAASGATCAVVHQWAAALIGIVSGVVYMLGVTAIIRLKIDDPVNAVPVHLGCGLWGVLAVGLFAEGHMVRDTFNIHIEPNRGLFRGGGIHQLVVQFLGVLLVSTWVSVVSFVMFYSLKITKRLRVGREEEEVGLDVAFHGGYNDDELVFDKNKYFIPASLRKRLTKKLEGGSNILSFLRLPMFSRGMVENVTHMVLWHKAMKRTTHGDFSYATYEANYLMEDTSHVESSPSGVFMGIYDGHGGPECSTFIREHLYPNLQMSFLQNGGVSEMNIARAFAVTEDAFTCIVRESFKTCPHLATVGSCALTVILSGNTLYVANLGDSKIILGRSPTPSEVEAVQLCEQHDVNLDEVRQRLIQQHPEDPNIVTERGGVWRIKGKVRVSHSFGDCYLKSREFNREPLFPRFRVTDPFRPPLVSSCPLITARILSPEDEFIILASDGLWELLPNEDAVRIVHDNPREDIARFLIKTALQRAAKKHSLTYSELIKTPRGLRREFHDDITCIIFFFNHFSSLRPAFTKASTAIWRPGTPGSVVTTAVGQTAGPSFAIPEESEAALGGLEMHSMELAGRRMYNQQQMVGNGVMDYALDRPMTSPSFSLRPKPHIRDVQGNVFFGDHNFVYPRGTQPEPHAGTFVISGHPNVSGYRRENVAGIGGMGDMGA